MTAFFHEGLLVHMMDMRHMHPDGTCMFGRSGCPEAAWYNQVMNESSATTVYDLPPNNDCGERCYGTTLLLPELPVSVFSTGTYRLGGAMIHDASMLWKYVQCAAVADSQTANRACCACQDQRFDRCPLRHPNASRHLDQGYCHAACDMVNGTVSSTCKALHAGCGPHLTEVLLLNFGPKGCSEEEIHSMRCDICSQPVWCDDAENWASDFYKAQTPEGFKRAFAYRDTMHRQCKWKPEQKGAFVETVRAFPKNNLGANENEINLYVGPGDEGASRALIDSLIAFGHFPETGMPADLTNLRRLADKFNSLGKAVPIVQINGEPPAAIRHWRKNRKVVLTDPPYNLVELESTRT
jgi:hypothetical protein